MSERKYHDEDWLREQYFGEGKPGTQIAEECGVSAHTIYEWMDKHGIERKDPGPLSDHDHADEEWLRQEYCEKGRSVPDIADELGEVPQTVYDAMDVWGIDRDATRYGHKSRVPYATYYTDDQGYPRWNAKGREDGERVTYNFHVHRLVAIAEFGVEAVIDKSVHHKNEVTWDNRPENLELLTRSEHRSEHMTPDTVDKMVRARGETPPTRADGGFDVEQRGLDGGKPEGQTTLDGGIVRDGGDDDGR